MQFTRVSVTPNACNLKDELTLNIRFQINSPARLRWTMEFLVDCAYSNITVPLVQVDSEDVLQPGEHSQTLHVDSLNTGDIPEHVLMNVGMLIVRAESLSSSGEPETVLAELKAMTQVSKPLAGGALTRTMFNPLPHNLPSQ